MLENTLQLPTDAHVFVTIFCEPTGPEWSVKNRLNQILVLIYLFPMQERIIRFFRYHRAPAARDVWKRRRTDGIWGGSSNVPHSGSILRKTFNKKSRSPAARMNDSHSQTILFKERQPDTTGGFDVARGCSTMAKCVKLATVDS
jgi:hypothetical protein